MSPPKDSPLAVATLLNMPPVEPNRGATHDTANVDPGYDSDAASASASSTSVSITSSIDFPCWEGTRRYHSYKQGRYFLPNDIQEQMVEEMKHSAALKILAGRLHLSPLRYPQNIVDVGTGTGSWAIKMSEKYPGAEVVGTDLSPIQPNWVPPNTKFFIDDAEAPWVESPDSLDFVFLRNMALAIRDWPVLLYQAYEALKPGGWVEIQDFHWAVSSEDGSMPNTWAPACLAAYVAEGLSKYNVNPYISSQLPNMLFQAGFTTMEPFSCNVPVGPWHQDQHLKDLGQEMHDIMMEGAHGLGFLPLHRGLKWNQEGFEMFLANVREGLRDPSVHANVSFHCVYAQKPLRDASEW